MLGDISGSRNDDYDLAVVWCSVPFSLVDVDKHFRCDY
jgi:hypothetical protein